VSLTTDDLVEINRLMAQYNFAVDGFDGAAFAACFTSDGRFFNGKELLAEGNEGLRAFPPTLARLGRIRHVTTSILAEGNGATAESRAYCQLLNSSKERGIYIMTQGIYRDRLVKTDGRWRFAERRFEADPV
jgi:hypothetical protein